ncbi:rSAM-modified peptide [Flavobacterium humidisoli]|uniref:RSAM-modified peptide n=1 Tax=Flavobacterium humidisoli TaxID=2937442 RepID=A0ABY4LXR2_9FLAO|nr:rSAM-modified peptide [Flavobacterium humidisoli]UPZ17024.1 rSAM-modified peptide [Flavobacterium humidisoli]
MKSSKLTFGNFQLEAISRKEQKTIKGGDAPVIDPTDPNEPKKTGGNGNP